MKWTLRLFMIFCALLGVRGLGIAWVTFSQRDLYQTFQAAGSWFLRVSINAAFGVIFLALFWGLYKRRRWTIEALLPLLAMRLLFDFIWLAAYAQAEFDRGRLVFAAATSLVEMGLSLWLWTRLPKQSWSNK